MEKIEILAKKIIISEILIDLQEACERGLIIPDEVFEIIREIRSKL